MKNKDNLRLTRQRRHHRVRKRVHGATERPRLSVFRSLVHIYAQVIDDTSGRTLAAASTLEAEAKASLDSKDKTEQAFLIGQLIGKRSVELGLRKIVFDRGGYRYHGRVKALADGARQAGLEF